MRIHELLGTLRKGSHLYNIAMASIKFDMGELDRASELSKASSGTFFELPAPICLFETHDYDQVHWYLAEDVSYLDGVDGVVWFTFFKQGCDIFASKYGTIIRKDGLINRLRIDHDCNEFRAVCEGEYVEDDDSSSRAMAMARAIEVFSCCNVSTTTHEPPKFINKKRIAKGKIPFFSYRTLHITPEPSVGHRGGATHASPRLHLRRGHIRKVSEEKKVWVRATLVGDKSKGFAAKGYSVGPTTYAAQCHQQQRTKTKD